jgi:hypothetical protein
LTDLPQLAPWLDKRSIAEHLGCSIRSINYAINDGMPHAIIFGRAKFQAAEVEAWLEQTGRLDRRGDSVTVDNASPFERPAVAGGYPLDKDEAAAIDGRTRAA